MDFAEPDEPVCVPARILNEYVYCPRLAYLEWVQGEFAVSADVIEGRHQHRHVDAERGQVTEPDGGNPMHATSVWLSAPDEQITAKIDLLESDGGAVIPVDYKHGALPDIPAQAWDTDRVQVAAQGLVLRANGYTCHTGIVYYIPSKTRIRIELDAELIALTRATVQGVLRMARDGRIPPPLVDSPKCPRCSLAGICLPDEVAFLASGDGLAAPIADGTVTEDEIARAGESARVDGSNTTAGEQQPVTNTASVWAGDYVDWPWEQTDRLEANAPKSDGNGGSTVSRTPSSSNSPSGDHRKTVPGRQQQATGVEVELRRILPARDDALPLHVTGYSARISKSGELLKIHMPGGTEGEARIGETSCVNLYGAAQMTTQALTTCLTRGIPVAFFSTGGWFQGIAHGMSHKNIELRLAQYHAHEEAIVRLDCARRFIAAKILNARTLLLRNHRADPVDAVRMMARLAGQARRATSLEQLLGIEGSAARAYFQSFDGMLKARDDDGNWSFDFAGRNRRPPRDPINAMLSYVYALLVKELTVTLLAVGFDPYLGLFHQPRYGRPALALDLMEEFRPVLADSTVLSAVNNRIVKPTDFIQRGSAVAMTPEGRKSLLRVYENRLDVLVTHPIFGYRLSYRRVLDVQARLLGRHLLGEIPAYPAFRIR